MYALTMPALEYLWYNLLYENKLGDAKAREVIDRVRAWAANKKDAPKDFKIAILSACNSEPICVTLSAKAFVYVPPPPVDMDHLDITLD